jgi:DNA-binding XRE family transcriptional regulator
MGRARYASNRGFYLALGKQIATRRDGRMTQEALAKQLKLSRTSLVNIEKGRQQVLVHTLTEIARILKCHVHDLIPPRDDVNALLSETPKKGRDWILNSAIRSTETP